MTFSKRNGLGPFPPAGQKMKQYEKMKPVSTFDAKATSKHTQMSVSDGPPKKKSCKHHEH